MPKNFDQDRRPVAAEDERQFVILGQTFTIKERVRPEVIIELDSLSEENSASQNIHTIDSVMCDLLVRRDRDRWRELRADDGDNPLELGDVQEILNWAMGVLTQRPLDNSSSSGTTSSSTEAKSQVPVSSPVVLHSTG